MDFNRLNEFHSNFQIEKFISNNENNLECFEQNPLAKLNNFKGQNNICLITIF